MDKQEDSERKDEQLLFQPPLWRQRRSFAFRSIKESKTTSVADLGCGEGSLLEILLNSCQFSQLFGVDIDTEAISRARIACKPRQDDYDFLRELPLKLTLTHGNIN